MTLHVTVERAEAAVPALREALARAGRPTPRESPRPSLVVIEAVVGVAVER